MDQSRTAGRTNKPVAMISAAPYAFDIIMRHIQGLCLGILYHGLIGIYESVVPHICCIWAARDDKCLKLADSV